MKNYIRGGVACIVLAGLVILAVWLYSGSAGGSGKGVASDRSSAGNRNPIASFFDSIFPSSKRSGTEAVRAERGTTAPASWPSHPAQTGVAGSAARQGEKSPYQPGGEKAAAVVQIDGSSTQLQPNQTGDFGRVLMAAHSLAKVTVDYTDAQAAQPVIVQAEDGGLLYRPGDNDPKKTSIIQVGSLDGSGQISLAFQSGDQDGVYRVTFRQGADLKQIDFWVGAEPAVAGVATASK